MKVKNKVRFLVNLVIALVGVIFTIIGFTDVGINSDMKVIFLSVGSSILAAGIIAFIDTFREERVKEIDKNIDNVLIDGGIEHVYKNRDLNNEYADLVNKAKHSIDIMGYSLRGFYDSNKDTLIKKCEENPKFLVRIILVNPESKFSVERDVEEYDKGGSFKIIFESLKAWSKKAKNIEIRLIDCQLSDMIYRIDDVMYTGPYFYKKSSKDTYTNKLNKNGWLFKAYQENFDKMWNDFGSTI